MVRRLGAALLIDWTLLDSEAAIEAFASRLAAAPISIARRTSISGAIRYAIPLFGRNPYEAERKVLDISGDGSNNDGGLVTDMRHEALKERIVINGLPIMNDRPNPFGFPSETDLDKYYLALRHRRAALLRRGGAQLRGLPPRRAQEAAAGSGRHRPALRFRHRRPRRACAMARSSRRAAASRRAVRGDDDYTKFVRPEYELGCDIGERRVARILAAPLRRHAGLSGDGLAIPSDSRSG